MKVWIEELGRWVPAISGGTGIEELLPLLAAIGSVAGAGTGIAKAVIGTPKTPAPPPPTTDTTQMARSLLPGARADTAARTGGGFAPDFLANVVGQQVGDPQAGLDILGDIRKGLGGSGGITGI